MEIWCQRITRNVKLKYYKGNPVNEYVCLMNVFVCLANGDL